MNPSQAIRLLSRRFKAKQSVLLTGAPGVGKTGVIRQAAELGGYDLIITYPAISEPTDARGLPFIDPTQPFAEFLPYGDLYQAMTATKPTIWFFDDLGQASPQVQAAYMQLFLAREVNGRKISDHIVFAAATNRKKDRGGVLGILEPVKSRFATIVELSPDVDSWIIWALSNNKSPLVIAFLQMHGLPMLFAPNPSSEIVNTPSPRTWSNFSDILVSGVDPDPVVAQEELAGATGLEAAAAFQIFANNISELPDINAVLLNPDCAAIPQELSALWLLASALAGNASEGTFRAICRYAQRLAESEQGEVGAFLINKSTALHPELLNTVEFARVLTHPLLGMYLS